MPLPGAYRSLGGGVNGAVQLPRAQHTPRNWLDACIERI